MYSLDTHAAIRALETAGIERKHAEAIVSTIARADEQTATKGDLASVKADLAALRSEVRWMFGFQAALILAIAARLFGIV